MEKLGDIINRQVAALAGKETTNIKPINQALTAVQEMRQSDIVKEVLFIELVEVLEYLLNHSVCDRDYELMEEKAYLTVNQAKEFTK